MLSKEHNSPLVTDSKVNIADKLLERIQNNDIKAILWDTRE